jgi:hypothetical protein
LPRYRLCELSLCAFSNLYSNFSSHRNTIKWTHSNDDLCTSSLLYKMHQLYWKHMNCSFAFGTYFQKCLRIICLFSKKLLKILFIEI